MGRGRVDREDSVQDARVEPNWEGLNAEAQRFEEKENADVK